MNIYNMWRELFGAKDKCIFSTYVHVLPGQRTTFCYVNDSKYQEKIVGLLLTPSGELAPGLSPIVREIMPGHAFELDATDELARVGITNFEGSFLALLSNVNPLQPFDISTKDHVTMWISSHSQVQIVTAGNKNINVPGQGAKKSFCMFCSAIFETPEIQTRVMIFNHSTEGNYTDTITITPKLHNLKGETIEGSLVTIQPFGCAIINVGEWFGERGRELLARTEGRGTLSVIHQGHTMGSLFFHVDRPTGALRSGQHTQPVVPAIFFQPTYNYWAEWIGTHVPFMGKIIPVVSFLRHRRSVVATFYPHHSNYVPSLVAYIRQSRWAVYFKMMFRALYFLIKRRFHIDEMRFSGENEHNEYVIQHNLWNNLKLFQFSRARIEYLMYPLMSIPSVQSKGKTLCIGPKNEGEILLLEAHGFRDVIGIDLFTYTPKILLMDMHEMTFPDNSFDTVFSGAVVRYSYDIKKVVSEMIRVAKDGAMIVCSFGLFPPEEELEFCATPLYGGIGELLQLFGKTVGHVYWWNEGQIPGKSSRICSVIFQLNKKNTSIDTEDANYLRISEQSVAKEQLSFR